MVLYVDLINSDKGHKVFNREYIRNGKSDFVYIGSHNSIKGFKDVGLVDFLSRTKSNRILNRIILLINWFKFIRFTKYLSSFELVFLCYDIQLLFLIKLWNKPAHLVVHNNIRELSSKWKKKVYINATKITFNVFTNEMVKVMNEHGLQNIQLVKYPKESITFKRLNHPYQEYKYLTIWHKDNQNIAVLSSYLSKKSVQNYLSANNIIILSRIELNIDHVVYVKGFLESDIYYSILSSSLLNIYSLNYNAKLRISNVLEECKILGIKTRDVTELENYILTRA